MYTLDGAYAMWDDAARGSIAAGKRADLVRLSASPVSVPAEKIGNITVQETIVGGEVIYRRDD